jgi:hypothetical protein
MRGEGILSFNGFIFNGPLCVLSFSWFSLKFYSSMGITQFLTIWSGPCFALSKEIEKLQLTDSAGESLTWQSHNQNHPTSLFCIRRCVVDVPP